MDAWTSSQLIVLLSLNLICTVAACLSIVSRYVLTLKRQIQKRLLLPLDNLITSKYYIYIVFEVFLILLAPYPGL